MKKSLFLFLVISLLALISCGGKANANKSEDEKVNTLMTEQECIKSDTYETNKGDLKVTLVGHASIIFEYAGKVIHVDPYTQVADYSRLPKADFIILTHEHADHLDTVAIDAIKKADTHYIVSKVCNEMLGYGDVMNNGDDKVLADFSMKAIPAYNMVNKNPQGGFYHPKGRGNGYIFTFGDKNVYVAGDTENIPEMDALKGTIDIAFLPKNLPYTMSDDMFIDAAKKVQPKVLYPYHMSEFDQGKIGKALDGTGVKLEIRPMKN
ncbi:MBL fold metallo-hydrolase [Dysgonomonas sp. Marseille-P4677]|uniref:MBL fold metallo-hydrolase n=1 Tax=Dysgonomonas sp. Marseille-P4677 TaxID=2364790 RepID=UPI0019131780|nr:MBL fold metallo-hydrolase [Dysgonomonas sp. Marseille-P4677]MBK5721243.1 MBL fold metallo-hydrolase [Dysgonomonas sp. Marseille-P4677]